jgi:hypothetical protein
LLIDPETSSGWRLFVKISGLSIPLRLSEFFCHGNTEGTELTLGILHCVQNDKPSKINQMGAASFGCPSTPLRMTAKKIQRTAGQPEPIDTGTCFSKKGNKKLKYKQLILPHTDSSLRSE